MVPRLWPYFADYNTSRVCIPPWQGHTADPGSDAGGLSASSRRCCGGLSRVSRGDRGSRGPVVVLWGGWATGVGGSLLNSAPLLLLGDWGRSLPVSGPPLQAGRRRVLLGGLGLGAAGWPGAGLQRAAELTARPAWGPRHPAQDLLGSPCRQQRAGRARAEPGVCGEGGGARLPRLAGPRPRRLIPCLLVRRLAAAQLPFNRARRSLSARRAPAGVGPGVHSHGQPGRPDNEASLP